MRLLIDCSLSLINRTGAHYIAQDLTAAFGSHGVLRRWRSLKEELPDGLARKVSGRLMLYEISLLGTSGHFLWPEPKGEPLKRLFLDPLYVSRSRLERSDIVLCHDIGPLTHSELYDAGAVRTYGLAYAKINAVRPGMVFVSQASQSAFEKKFGTGYRFLKTIPLYVRPGSMEGSLEPVPAVPPPFFLTVAALEKRKNLASAIEAF